MEFVSPCPTFQVLGAEHVSNPEYTRLTLVLSILDLQAKRRFESSFFICAIVITLQMVVTLIHCFTPHTKTVVEMAVAKQTVEFDQDQSAPEGAPLADPNTFEELWEVVDEYPQKAGQGSGASSTSIGYNLPPDVQYYPKAAPSSMGIPSAHSMGTMGMPSAHSAHSMAPSMGGVSYYSSRNPQVHTVYGDGYGMAGPYHAHYPPSHGDPYAYNHGHDTYV